MKPLHLTKALAAGFSAAGFLLVAGCDQEKATETAEADTEEAAAFGPADLKAIDRTAATMAMEQGMLVYDQAFFTDDAIQLDDGKEMIDDGLFAILEDHRNLPPDLAVTWAPQGAGIAESGELGYTWGRWSNFSYDEDGTMIDTYGKYVTIWKKQDDGTWKIAVDIWNSEDPQE